MHRDEAEEWSSLLARATNLSLSLNLNLSLSLSRRLSRRHREP